MEVRQVVMNSPVEGCSFSREMEERGTVFGVCGFSGIGGGVPVFSSLNSIGALMLIPF